MNIPGILSKPNSQQAAKPKSLTYAGIGSRKTPQSILTQMTGIAAQLQTLGYTLHSGGADGADSAFEAGVSNNAKKIFLPWRGFNGNNSSLFTIPQIAFTIAEKFHPAWHKCSQGAKKLHARNCQQILGPECATPVDFVICWHNGTGGTTQACRIAAALQIPIINLIDASAIDTLKKLTA